DAVIVRRFFLRQVPQVDPAGAVGGGDAGPFALERGDFDAGGERQRGDGGRERLRFFQNGRLVALGERGLARFESDHQQGHRAGEQDGNRSFHFVFNSSTSQSGGNGADFSYSNLAALSR